MVCRERMWEVRKRGMGRVSRMGIALRRVEDVGKREGLEGVGVGEAMVEAERMRGKGKRRGRMVVEGRQGEGGMGGNDWRRG